MRCSNPINVSICSSGCPSSQCTMNSLTELRDRLGLTNRQVADILGVSVRTAEDWAQNRSGHLDASTRLRVAVKISLVAGARAIAGNAAWDRFPDYLSIDHITRETALEIATIISGGQFKHPLLTDDTKLVCLLKFQITLQRFSPIEHLCRLCDTKTRN